MRIAMLQTTTGIDPAANAAALVEAIGKARAGGADMLFTPEMSNFLDRNRQRAATTIQQQDQDPVLQAVSNAAQQHRLWVNLGSIAVRDPGSDKWRNRSLLIGPDGTVRACYDKIHLFDVELATGESWRESAVYAGGDQTVVADTPWGPVGLSICYDLRFASLYAAMAALKPVMMTVPAAFTVPTGEAHWHVLLRARAIESACFIMAAAQTGSHEDGRSTYGHSLVIDPWGEVLLDMGSEPGLALIDIDLARVDAVRAQVPVLANRRPIAQAVRS